MSYIDIILQAAGDAGALLWVNGSRPKSIQRIRAWNRNHTRRWQAANPERVCAHRQATYRRHAEKWKAYQREQYARKRAERTANASSI